MAGAPRLRAPIGIRSIVDRSWTPALAAFAIAALAIAIIALAQGIKPFYHDSGGYWRLSETFTVSGHFSLLDFESTGLRGYVLPLIYWAFRNVAEPLTGNESLMVRGFNVLTFALIGTVLAPRLATIAWPTLSWSVGRRLALTALVVAFWSGYLSYPLSDFPALTVALLALIAIAAVNSPLSLLVAGLCAGLALNMRPAYVLLMPLLVALLAWSWIERRHEQVSFGRRLACVVALLAGFASVTVPQSLYQHESYGDFSPIPGPGLSRFQYAVGLELQRYDTYVNGPARMEYLDDQTGDVIAGLDEGTVSGTGEYLGLVIRHPITMGGLFLRHVVNGLDQRYTTPYVETLEADRDGMNWAWHLLLRVGGFLLVFLALVRVALPAGRRSLGPAQWRYPAVLLVISAPSISSAVETRFLLPAFLLSAILVIAPGWPRLVGDFWAGSRRWRELGLLVAAGALYATGVWAIVSAATDSLRLS